MSADAAKTTSGEELIAAITAKLQSNRAVVEQSISFGRLTWRQGRNGQFEIDLEPRI